MQLYNAYTTLQTIFFAIFPLISSYIPSFRDKACHLTGLKGLCSAHWLCLEMLIFHSLDT